MYDVITDTTDSDNFHSYEPIWKEISIAIGNSIA